MAAVVCEKLYFAGDQRGDGMGIGRITLHIELGTQYPDILLLGMYDKSTTLVAGDGKKSFSIQINFPAFTLELLGVFQLGRSIQQHCGAIGQQNRTGFAAGCRFYFDPPDLFATCQKKNTGDNQRQEHCRCHCPCCGSGMAV